MPDAVTPTAAQAIPRNPLAQKYDIKSKGISIGEKVGWTLAGASVGAPAVWSMRSLWKVMPQAVEEYELVMAAPELLLPLMA